METNLNTDFTTITDVLQQVSGVAGVGPDQDFYEAGVTSVMALPLLMELEERFGVSIPDDRFVEARTPRLLHQLVSDLSGAAS